MGMKTSVHFLDRQLGDYCLDQKSIDQPPKQYPVPGYEIVGSAKLRKRDLEIKQEEIFPATAPFSQIMCSCFRVPLTYASSLLSESLEHATQADVLRASSRVPPP